MKVIVSRTLTSMTTKISRVTGRNFGKMKEWFGATGNNFDKRNETKPMRHNFIKIGETCLTPVRNSDTTDRTFKPIGSIVGKTATRPGRIDARCITIGKICEPTIERVGEVSPRPMGLDRE